MAWQELEPIHAWLNEQLGPIETVYSLIGDASPRRYWRIKSQTNTFILMHAPDPTQRTPEFITIAKYLGKLGLSVPKIIAVAPEGWVLLSDLGQLHYQDVLSPATVDVLYTKAMESIVVMQRAPCDSLHLPVFNAGMMNTELMLFEHWFVEVFLNQSWAAEDKEAYYEFKDALISRIEKQPLVFVHRDFHSRNLMVRPPATPGIIDFQDAVIGPMTYDLISLTQDAYVAWPSERVAAWNAEFLDLVNHAKLLSHAVELPEFKSWCVDMALQRQFKVIGIFARLCCRDNKVRYVEDMPRVANYLCQNLRAAAPMVPVQFMSFWFNKMIPLLEKRVEKQLNAVRGMA